jgi:hypothetical protein
VLYKHLAALRPGKTFVHFPATHTNTPGARVPVINRISLLAGVEIL